MSGSQPRYSKEEFAQRGDSLFECEIRPRLTAEDQGKFVVIDIESGAFEIDEDELLASDRLRAKHPRAQPWLRRIGSRHARRIGSRPRADISFPGQIAPFATISRQTG